MEIAEPVVALLSLVLDLAPCHLQGLILPLLLAGLENLEHVLLEAAALVAVGTAHHSVIDKN